MSAQLRCTYSHDSHGLDGVLTVGTLPAEVPGCSGRRSRQARRRPAARQRCRYGLRMAAPATPVIRLEAARKEYPDGTVAVEGLDLEVREHELMVLVGPVRLREVDDAADGQPARRADLRPGARAGRGRDGRRRRRAAPPDRVRHPARRAVPAPHGRPERRHRAGPAAAGTPGAPGSAPPSCWTWSAWTTRSTARATPTSCPAASSSGSGWPARLPSTRRCC